MGGFLGIGGSSAKTDRNQTLAGYQDLNSAFNFANPAGQKQIATGQNTTGAGLSGLSNAAGYYAKLASGNRPAALQAIAPQTNAINAQADAARRQSATMGTSRGGGTAGANQQADTTKNAQIDNMLFGAQGSGVSGEASTGGAIANVGENQTNEGLNLFGQGTGAAQDVTGDALNSRQTSYNINQQTQQGVTSAIMSGLAMFA